MTQQSTCKQFLLLSDSLSCLQSLQNWDMSHPLISEILCRVHELKERGFQLIFIWVPSHVGLAGNSAADAAAKAALNLPVTNLTIPYSDYKSMIRTYTLNQWQQSWSLQIQNKLHAVEPTVNKYNSYRLPRRDEIIIHRLRIGHIHLTHGHLLKRESPPQCGSCQVELTVEHILVHCTKFKRIRDNFYSVTSMSELFSKVTLYFIISFIKKNLVFVIKYNVFNILFNM